MEASIQTLIHESEQHVRNLFHSKQAKHLVYHNLNHTREVVHHCEHMADIYGIEGEDEVALLVAAWFHDTGYLKGPSKGHEDESKKIARDFLKGLGADRQLIEKVESCIEATKVPQQPKNLIEEILCDADLYHLGTDGFYERSLLLREEINLHKKDDPVSKKEWRQQNVKFLESHHYFTQHAKEFLDPVKKRNLEALEEKAGKKHNKQDDGFTGLQSAQPVTQIQEPQEKLIGEEIKSEEQQVIVEADDIRRIMEEERMKATQVVEEVVEEGEKKKKKKNKDPELAAQQKEKRTERGVVAMFRIMSENHVNLSQMADSKANIMISINTIVVSILVSVLLGKLQFYPQYTIPTIMLMAVCLGAIVFAILATRPNISEGKFTEQDIRNKQINLLFFGNFYNMQLEDYDWAMKEMMNDKEYLYGSMIKDMYFLGVVLARKYKLLRISYNIFMFGIVASILAFGVAMMFFQN